MKAHEWILLGIMTFLLVVLVLGFRVQARGQEAYDTVVPVASLPFATPEPAPEPPPTLARLTFNTADLIADTRKMVSSTHPSRLSAEPVTRITDGLASTGTGASLSRVYRVTAYCPCEKCCGKWADGITASGAPVTVGRFVAADKSIPFGTLLTIPGYGTVPVLDRGGAMKGPVLDVFFADNPGEPGSGHQKALEWGVQWLEVSEWKGM